MTEPASWISVHVHPQGNRDGVVAALFAAGAQGVQELGDDLVTQLSTVADADAAVRAVLAASPASQIETRPLAVVDWSEEWKKGIGAHEVGSLVIVPPWLADGYETARRVVIEPAMAFGTGEHATTRGVIRLLQTVLAPGDHVADLGAGSAVLAIAAAKLGAARVAAIELDHDAIANAEENVRCNGVDDRVVVIEGDARTLLPLVAPVRIVLANILSHVIIELLPTIQMALEPGGRVIVSGILTTERDGVLGHVTNRGWELLREDVEEIWWSAILARR